jgi:hypothetical protein
MMGIRRWKILALVVRTRYVHGFGEFRKLFSLPAHQIALKERPVR